jgi:hypothetical protein
VSRSKYPHFTEEEVDAQRESDSSVAVQSQVAQLGREKRAVVGLIPGLMAVTTSPSLPIPRNWETSTKGIENSGQDESLGLHS